MKRKSRSTRSKSSKPARLQARLLRRTAQTGTRWAVAILLLPCVWAATKGLVAMVPSVGAEGWRSWWVYLAGATVYGAVEIILAKPMALYVFGHELTHAISGILSGAKIYDFKVSSKGGEVQLSKSNLWVALSPYVVPIYAVFVMGFYAVARVWIHHPQLTHAFQFLLGASVAFHLSLTFSAFHQHQPDLKGLGLFLSGVLVALGNVLILALFCISLFHRTPTLKAYGKAVALETGAYWRDGFKFVFNNAARHWPPEAVATLVSGAMQKGK